MRSSDALGASLILVGYTPRPIGETLNLIKKTAIGAEKTVTWEHLDHHQEVLDKYSDFQHLAIEITENSQNLFDFLKNSPSLNLDKLILWFGNEIHGLPADLCQKVNQVVHLPMSGMKESLNVANTVTTTGYLFLYSQSFSKFDR